VVDLLTDDSTLFGLEEWQGALIIVTGSLLAIGLCIALGLVINYVIVMWLEHFEGNNIIS